MHLSEKSGIIDYSMAVAYCYYEILLFYNYKLDFIKKKKAKERRKLTDKNGFNETMWKMMKKKKNSYSELHSACCTLRIGRL